MIKRLLAVLAIVAALILNGGAVFAQSNQYQSKLELVNAELAVIHAQAKALEARNNVGRCVAVEQYQPMVATYESQFRLKPPEYAADNPPALPVAQRPAIKSEPVSSQLPRVPAAVPMPSRSAVPDKTPQIVTSTNPYIPQAVAGIRKEKKIDEKTPGVVSKVEINHSNIAVLFVDRPLKNGMKVAIEIMPGKYKLGVIREELTPHGIKLGGDFEPEPVSLVPRDYEIIKLQELREAKS